MKKVMCAKCGGSTKTKMAKGGSMKTTVGKATPKGQIGGIPQTGPTGPNYQGVDTMKKGGTLKPVPSDKVGLAKLPTAVRNKMGYKKKGGPVIKKR